MLRHIAAAAIPHNTILNNQEDTVVNFMRTELQTMIPGVDKTLDECRIDLMHSRQVYPSAANLDGIHDVLAYCGIAYDYVSDLIFQESFGLFGVLETPWQSVMEFVYRSLMAEPHPDNVSLMHTLETCVSKWKDFQEKAPELVESLKIGCPDGFQVITEYFTLASQYLGGMAPVSVDEFIRCQQTNAIVQEQYRVARIKSENIHDMFDSVKTTCANNKYRVTGVECLSCGACYDGNAQCCQEMDHISVDTWQ